MNKYYPFNLLLWLTIFLSSIFEVKAQIIPDQTLGAEQSIVTPLNQLNHQINGGAKRGINLFHSFREFNIQPGRGVYFHNPIGVENILTRVTGNDISDILGTLGVQGNANLFLINPNGINFGKDATLDIRGSFTATTADSVQLGKDGLFNATNPQNSNLLNIQPNALFTNAIRQHQATINNQGNLSVDAGKSLIFFGDQIINSGNLSAPAGNIFIFADNINLLNHSQINVSSFLGGGTVLIGGNFSGADNFPTAKNTFISFEVSIKADAIKEGNGGNVVIWADENTHFYGNISAQGGWNFGNGGFVEVSAKGNLVFRGDVNTNAQNGLPGNLLIDPTNIIIANGSDSINDIEIEDGEILASEVSNTFTISEQKIENLSGNTNLILQATNDIILQNLDDNFLYFQSGTGTIELIADSDNNGIGNFIMEDTQDTIRTNGRDIKISAANLQLGFINTTFLGGTEITTINVDAGGEIIDAQGTLDNRVPISTEFNFTVTNAGEISDLDVVFSATHTYVEDLEVSLTSPHPQGTTVKLFAFIGGDGMNFQDTRLNNQATNRISNFSQTAPFNGEFIPEGNLDRFNGENANGIWKLTVIDHFPDFAGNLFKSGDSNIPWTNPIGTQLILTSGIANGDSGSIQLNATNGNINAMGLDTSSTSGTTGSIVLNATGEIGITEQIKTFHNNNGNGGNVSIKASDNINLNGLLNTSALGDNLGDGGTILIKSENGSLTVNGIDTRGRINGGNVNLLASEKVFLNNSINTNGVNGISGDINITANGDINFAQDIELAALSSRGLGGNVNLISEGNITMNGGAIFNDSNPLLDFDREAGNINIIANTFTAQNTAQIVTSNFGKIDAGDIKITAEKILINNSLISSRVAQSAIGNGGNIEFIADSISVIRSASISSSSQGLGNAGNITIKSSNFNLANNAEISAFSSASILSSSQGSGNAGDITIKSSNLNLANNAAISAFSSASILSSSEGSGNAGNITIKSSNLNLSNNAEISAFSSASISSSSEGSGNAGDITLQVRDNIILDRENTGLFANNQGNGEGGNIGIQADNLTLENQGFISAETNSSQGGEINLNITELLLLRNNSRISTTAGTAKAGGNGGNVNINSPLIVAFPNENSDITANAFSGKGGQIDITSKAILGLKLSSELTPKSDITASSQFGLDGEVILNTPDVDPTSSLIELPKDLTDTANQLYQGCGRTAKQNTFTSIGRGGLPSNPNDLFTGITPLIGLVDTVNLNTKNNSNIKLEVINNESSKHQNNNSNPQIQEAQGWIITSDGRVILTAKTTQVNLQSSGLHHSGCFQKTDSY